MIIRFAGFRGFKGHAISLSERKKRGGIYFPGRDGSAALMAFLIFALCLTGCGKKYDPVPPPDYKFNPSPQQRYLVTVRSGHDLPREATVRIQYEIENDKCIPVDYTRALGGIRISDYVRVLEQPAYLSNKELEAIVSADKILPGDYWGLGVCRWTMDAAIVIFGKSDASYSIELDGENIESEGWFAWGCMPPTGAWRSPQCGRLGSNDSWHADEFLVKPPNDRFEWQMFWINSKKEIGK